MAGTVDAGTRRRAGKLRKPLTPGSWDLRVRGKDPEMDRVAAWAGWLRRREGEPAPARRSRPDTLGHMLAHRVMGHSWWGPGPGGQRPGAKVRVLGGCRGL